MATALSFQSPGAAPVATASGWLAMLQEPDEILQTHALKQLLGCVDMLWHEVAESLPELEALAEDTDMPATSRQMAAAVASRVFFHLDEPTQALRLAMDAGEAYFDLHQRTPYVERLVAAALDVYIRLRQKHLDDGGDDAAGSGTTGDEDDDEDDEASGLAMDQLKQLVYRMIQTSCKDGKYEDALGIALEARETEQVRSILNESGTMSLLHYALQSAVSVVSSKSFRGEVLTEVAACLKGHFATNKSASNDLVLVHQLLKQPQPVADVLTTLFEGTEEEALLGYQLCFDLIDSGDQAFVQEVASGLKDDSSSSAGASEGQESTAAAAAAASSESSAISKHYAQAKRVLVGGFSSELTLSFLHKQSNADRLVMENLKKSLEERGGGGRNSILHNAAVMTHAYLNAGTTNDSFLRDYLDWMKKASNWAKFSATASLGVVHSGHITEAMNLMQPYLPPEPADDAVDGGAGNVPTTGGYAEGGSLFALGIIHGSHAGSNAVKRKEASELLRKHLRVSHANEVISHGAALGVGLTAFGSADVGVVNELKDLLYKDSAVAGEAAGMAVGMVLVGTGAGNSNNSLSGSGAEDLTEIVAELKNYARETQHEKIIRGISVGLALIQYGQEENADATIEEMRSDRDPVLRYGAQYALALAYCGTGSNKAIRILLHTAVSDVSDDVRMAAVIGLAFVLYKTPERVPQLVKLLLESFNPHVRYASCMAVGIAMAGTGDSESVALLEPMIDDMTDYVRQGALVGTAMIYMQQSDTCNGRKIRMFREKLSTLVSDKHQSTLTKMGAIMAKGVIDAGGRNCTIALGSRSGFTKMSTAVGLALWLQHWHWYPMMHMFSLALTPSCTIGLNKDFKFPRNFEVQCNSKPSVFAYPRKLEEKKEEKKKRVETVTLSTTAKNKARLARKKAKVDGDSPMDVDEKKEDGADATTTSTDAADKKEDGANTETDGAATGAMDVDGEAKPVPDKPVKKKREPEPTSFRVKNPARITKEQSNVCEFDLDQRYRPIRPNEKPFGVIILTDSTPGEEEDLGAVHAPSMEPEGECAPPEPFEWTPPGWTEPTEMEEDGADEKKVKVETIDEGDGDDDAQMEESTPAQK